MQSSGVPADVVRAGHFIKCSLAVGLVTMVVAMASLLVKGFSFMLLILLWLIVVGFVAIAITITGWVIRKLLLRRNWMRWLLTSLFIAGLVLGLMTTSLTAYADWFRTQTVQAVGTCLQWALSVVAVLKLHTRESREWFTQSQEPHDRAA